MNKGYTWHALDNDSKITLPFPGKNSCSAEPWMLKAGKSNVIVLDHKQRKVGYILKGQVKVIKAVKPKWYQFIKKIRGEYRWVIQ